PDGSLAELLLEGLDELDQGQRVGLEVVGERVPLVDGAQLDLEDVGQAVPDELEDGAAIERTLLHVRLSGHGCSSCAGRRRFSAPRAQIETRAVYLVWRAGGVVREQRGGTERRRDQPGRI